MTLRVLALAGDGIGPEVMAQGLRVLHLVAALGRIEIAVREDLIHGQAWDAYGVFCRDETVAAALDSHGVLVGAVGGPRWDGLVPDGTPDEQDDDGRIREGPPHGDRGEGRLRLAGLVRSHPSNVPHPREP